MVAMLSITVGGLVLVTVALAVRLGIATPLARLWRLLRRRFTADGLALQARLDALVRERAAWEREGLSRIVQARLLKVA
jgi:hypothetical protein